MGRQMIRGRPESHLELAYGLVQESHLHVGRTQVVVSPDVIGRKVQLEVRLRWD